MSHELTTALSSSGFSLPVVLVLVAAAFLVAHFNLLKLKKPEATTPKVVESKRATDPAGSEEILGLLVKLLNKDVKATAPESPPNPEPSPGGAYKVHDGKVMVEIPVHLVPTIVQKS